MTKALKERSRFREKEGRLLLDQAEACVRAALKGEALPEFGGDLAESPVVGVFVSLKRGTVLRACCGMLNEGEAIPLGEVLNGAAERAALNDVRFPRIMESELAHLDIEVSVMHHLEVLPADPNERINSIVIGEHGLILSFNRGRGLLLPQVASENNWNAPTFLEHLCRKANVPTDSWLRSEAEIKRFSASIFRRKGAVRDMDFRELPESVRLASVEYAGAVIRNGIGNAPGIPEKLQLPVCPAGWGMLIQTRGRRTEVVFRKEGNLGELIRETAKALHQANKPEANEIRDFLVFSHPIELAPEDYPRRHGNFQKGFAISARETHRTTVVLKQGPQDPILQVLKQMGKAPASWKSGLEVSAHLVVKWDVEPEQNGITLPSELTDGVRPAAVAGRFYPSVEEEMRGELERFFEDCEEVEEKVRARAVMLPHAGWKFCGDIIADTLNRIEIPDTVFILGPKHTPLGARWAMSRAKRWQIPGAEIPLDEESCAFVTGHVRGLVKDDLAHQREHGIEVLVPFLHHLNPDVRIIPVVVGAGTYEEFVEFGESLKPFRRRLERDGEDCLFVISSDLNHFAGEQENRRRDRLALDALQTGDTGKLFETCRQHDISMCGLRPAVAILSSLDLDPIYPNIRILKYDTSARITRDPSRVVGYAGAIIH